MEDEKPLFLITNDDGLYSKGIASLIRVAKEFGEVVVVAPDRPRSGMAHAITTERILRLHPSSIFNDVSAYTCSGTPVDCVKIALSEVLGRTPDLLLSGINHGANTASNTVYSGTMAAAIEGAMNKIPSVGFSLLDFDTDADFSATEWAVREIIPKVLLEKENNPICLNVNVPKIDLTEIKGIKVCRQADSYWESDFHSREDQFGRPYYWLKGDFIIREREVDTDIWAVENNFVSIVPVKYDLTQYALLSTIKNLEFNK